METRHIKLDYEEALSAKKQLLTTQLNLLHTLKKLKSYRLLRNKELIQKNKLKSSVSILKTRINLIQSTFPRDAEENTEMPKKQRHVEKEKTKVSTSGRI